MRAIIQRVSQASVTVNNPNDRCTTAAIRTGLVVLLGVAATDIPADAEYLSDRILGLRIFPDDSGKMNRNIGEIGGSLLVISQFTLYADCRKGRRPSFDRAARPEAAIELYDYFVEMLRRSPIPVETGVFQATMDVHLVNQGPVTIILDSADRKPSPPPSPAAE
jgi:D-tyrosyl-tRNA(Tyr) deacylase